MKKKLLFIAMICAMVMNIQAQTMLKDLCNGKGSSYPFQFINLDENHVLFTAQDSLHGRELWITDGTAEGTSLIMDIYTGMYSSYPSFIDTVGGKMIFFATTAEAGKELWVTDGTTAGTMMLKDVYPGSGDAFTYENIIGRVGNKIFLIVNNSPYGTELYVTNGTTAGTALVKDIVPGAGSGLGSYDDIGVAFGNKVYFSCYGTSGNGREMWSSDGTSAGTQLFKQFDNFPYGYRKSYSNFIFAAYTSTYGTEIWKSDGTAAGTVLVNGGDIYPGTTGSNPRNMIADGNYYVYFTANDGVRGSEWYYYGGSLYEVNEIVAGPSGPLIDKVFEPRPGQYSYDSYFSANDFYHGNELYLIKQTNVYLLKDINPSGSSNISNFTYFDDIAFFTADDGVHGDELWTTDGTPSGTRMLTDIMPGFRSSIYSNIAVINGKILFSATDGSSGYELFAADLSTLLSIENNRLSSNQRLNIYPNPAKDNIMIETVKPGILSIYNLEGKELLNLQITNLQSQIDVSMLPAGFYIAKYINDDGVGMMKLIKE